VSAVCAQGGSQKEGSECGRETDWGSQGVFLAGSIREWKGSWGGAGDRGKAKGRQRIPREGATSISELVKSWWPLWLGKEGGANSPGKGG
jgi:hypothetical protein